MEEKKFSYPKTFLLGFGFFGVSVIWSVYNAYVPLMLDGKYGLSAGWIGFFMVLDNIAALLIQPPLGAFSDRLRSPMGRRLPFVLLGAPIGAIAFGFIPLASALPLFIMACVILLLSMAFWRTPIVALMPDVTPSRFRSQANGVINFMGGLAAVLSFAVGAKLYAMNPAYAFWMGSGLVIISSMLVLIFIREPREYVAKKTHLAEMKGEQGQRKKVLDSIKEVFSHEDKSASRILLAILFWFLSYNAVEAFFTLYGVKHLGLAAADSGFQLTYISLVFLIFAIPSGYIAAKFGRRRTIMTGIVIMAVCILLMYFLSPALLSTSLSSIMGFGVYPVSLVLMLAGIGWALININSLPMVVDMTDDDHVGTYTGLYYFASQTAAILGPVAFGGLIEVGGNDYRLMMLLSPIFLVVAFFLMFGVRRGEAKK
jgi:Na+/melibiose symporter-like transporter